MSKGEILAKWVALSLSCLAVFWMFQAIWHSINSYVEWRPLIAGTILSGMVGMLAGGCISQSRIVRVLAVIAGLILVLREYLMFTEGNASIVELLVQPGGWIGPLLVIWLLFAMIVTVTGLGRKKASRVLS